MRSSSGQYYIALDHVRALAALMVFSWHFIHAGEGHLAEPPAFPLSLLAEGHTGVALFMTLSGYVFAKLLDGRRIRYLPFLWNRAIRLFPLLVVVFLLVGLERYLQGEDLRNYLHALALGFWYPSWPNGGWSITVELHYYALLPLLLALMRVSPLILAAALLGALALRTGLFLGDGEVQGLAYWTLVGRVDQFLLGMLGYHFSGWIRGRHGLATVAALGFAGFYWVFDWMGGFYTNPGYPSPSPIWIILPMVEGLAYATLIAWYDRSFEHRQGAVSSFIGRVGASSYSIYLLHFFVVFRLSEYLHRHFLDLSNTALAIGVSLLAFGVMIPIGWLSFRFVETPLLRYRLRYTR